MPSLRRDIILTLLLKTVLLTALWVVCFKGVEPQQKTTAAWLLSDENTDQR